jgi:hypothetical protein
VGVESRRSSLALDSDLVVIFSRVAFGYAGEDTTISVLQQGGDGLAGVEALLEDKSVRTGPIDSGESVAALFALQKESISAISKRSLR